MTDNTHSASDVQRILMFDGFDIPETLADSVRRQVLRRIPSLDCDRAYSLKQICGPEFWATLNKWDAIRSGQYVAYLVATSQLPLVFDVCPHRTNKKYRLK